MSDNFWVKPYIEHKHYCKPKMRSEEFSQPCDADEIQPFTDNGTYGNCDSSSTKKRCDLTCNEGFISVGSNKWVCKNEMGEPVITEEGGQCKQVPELPSPPDKCKPPSTWTQTGSYTEGVHSPACDSNSNDCAITYKLLCKKGYEFNLVTSLDGDVTI
jgi:hypothetical protein